MLKNYEVDEELICIKFKIQPNKQHKQKAGSESQDFTTGSTKENQGLTLSFEPFNHNLFFSITISKP